MMVEEEVTLKSAPMDERIWARIIDLAVILMLSVAAFVVYIFVVYIFYVIDTCIMSHCPYSDEDHWVFLGTSAAVVVIVELLVGMWSGTSVGKRAVDLKVADYKYRRKRVSPWRARSRYLVAVLAWAALTGVTVLIGSTAKINIEGKALLFIAGASSLIVWLSALLSALFRSDRRGWHDLLAGTVLVSTRVPPFNPKIGK